MKSFKEYIAELFNQPAPFRSLRFTGARHSYSFNSDGHLYKVTIEKHPNGPNITGDPDTWTIDFANVDLQGHSNFDRADIGTAAAIKVFSTVIDIVNKFIQDSSPNYMTLIVDKEDSSRVSLYRRIIQNTLRREYIFKEQPVGGGHYSDYLRFIIQRKNV
jgi:hypothetical protein